MAAGKNPRVLIAAMPHTDSVLKAVRKRLEFAQFDVRDTKIGIEGPTLASLDPNSYGILVVLFRPGSRGDVQRSHEIGLWQEVLSPYLQKAPPRAAVGCQPLPRGRAFRGDPPRPAARMGSSSPFELNST